MIIKIFDILLFFRCGATMLGPSPTPEELGIYFFNPPGDRKVGCHIPHPLTPYTMALARGRSNIVRPFELTPAEKLAKELNYPFSTHTLAMNKPAIVSALKWCAEHTLSTFHALWPRLLDLHHRVASLEGENNLAVGRIDSLCRQVDKLTHQNDLLTLELARVKLAKDAFVTPEYRGYFQMPAIIKREEEDDDTEDEEEANFPGLFGGIPPNKRNYDELYELINRDFSYFSTNSPQ